MAIPEKVLSDFNIFNMTHFATIYEAEFCEEFMTRFKLISGNEDLEIKLITNMINIIYEHGIRDGKADAINKLSELIS